MGRSSKRTVTLWSRIRVIAADSWCWAGERADGQTGRRADGQCQRVAGCPGATQQKSAARKAAQVPSHEVVGTTHGWCAVSRLSTRRQCLLQADYVASGLIRFEGV